MSGLVAGRRRRRRGPPGDLGTADLIRGTATPACVIDPFGRLVAANHPLEALLGSAVTGGLDGRTLTC